MKAWQVWAQRHQVGVDPGQPLHGCGDQVPYKTEGDAAFHIRARMKRNGRLMDGAKKLTPFRCDHCGRWHIKPATT